jgi:hypothetical protein
MAVKKYVAINSQGIPQQYPAIDQSLGADSAGQIVAVGADGRIHPSLLPTGFDGATLAPSAIDVLASEPLSAGDWVNLFNSSGTRKARRALASTQFRTASGFVTDAVTAGDIVTVFLDGINAKVPKASFTLDDLNIEVKPACTSLLIVLLDTCVHSG